MLCLCSQTFKEMITIKKLIIILAISISIILSGCWIVPDSPIPTEIANRVLLIGAGDYDGCGNDLTAPPYAVNSMEELFNRCYDIKILTILKDKQATKKNILDEIWYTFKDATEDDISIFYFAGHGGDKNNTFQILPTDYSINGKISITELEYWLDKISGTKIVILDACHSGGFVGKNIIKLLNKSGYQVLTSCTSKQFCYMMHGTSFNDPYMIFTRGILEGCGKDYLADIDFDGIITMTEAYNFSVNWIAENHSYEQDAQIYPKDSIFPIIEY